jgi:DNA-binding SARP family transcriptional activator
MDFRILGPLEVLDEGRVLTLGGSKQRALLALLVLHANETLSTDRLIDELWGECPPATAAKTVQVHISRLRKALAREAGNGSADDGVIVTRDYGYALELDPEHLDARRFERLVAEGRSELAAGRSHRAASLLEEALSLWRGAPLADLAYEPFAQREISRLDDLRLAALEQLIDAKLAVGAHAEVLGQLESLIGEYPYRERLRAQLMLALYRSDRQADALQAYQSARKTLIEELGIEPGERLRDLERAILAQDSKLQLAAAEEPAAQSQRGAFVGRAQELGELIGALDDSIAGRGRLFLLAGEPGIGKSRLAEELIGHARARGARVLVGRCWEAGGAPAYWPWVQSLRTYIADRDRGRLREELGAGAGELAHLLPELRERLPDLPEPTAGDPEAARFRLFDAVSSFLRCAAAERPLVLVLDDLHAADEPSLLLLQFIARALGDSHLLVLAAYRDVDPTLRDPLVTAVAELTREPVTRRIALTGLAESDIGEYVSMTAGVAAHSAIVATIHAQTEGNALFVDEVTRLLIAEGALDRGSHAGIGIPQGVRDVIGRRMRRLSEECRRALAMASVLGREFSLDALARMTGREPRGALGLLDEALESRAVSEVPGAPDRLRFSHALVRDTLYEGLTPARRLDLHMQAGEALEALYAENPEPHLAELAYHFAQAAPAGDAERAIRYARRAAERAAGLLAFEEATRLYRLALRLTDDDHPGARAQRSELLVALGDVQARAGEMPAARESFLHAAEIAREADLPVQLAQAALGYGGRFVFTRGASEPHLVPLLEQAVAALRDDGSALHVRVLARLASALRDERSREPRGSLSSQALEAARRLGEPATLAYALSGRLSAMMGPDSFEQRLALATELGKASDKEHALEGHLHRIVVLLALGDLSAIHADLAAVERLASELRQPTQQWLAAVVGATIAMLEGRLPDAEELIECGQALGERAQRYEMLSFSYLQQFGLRRKQGRLGEIAQEFDGAPAQFPTRPVYRCALAALHAELGRRDEARQVLAGLAGEDFTFATLPVNNDLLLSTSLLAEAATACGDLRSAEGLYRILLPYAALNVDTLELSTGAVARYLGLLAAALERPDDAERHFDEAMAVNTRTGAGPWLAHAQGDLARLLLTRGRRGDGERAATLLEQAQATARELGLTELDKRLRSLDVDHPASAG